MAFGRLMLGCILLFGTALDAAAQEPAGAKIPLDAARKECRKEGGLRVNVEPEAIRSIDLTGDGRADIIVDYNYLTCQGIEPEIFCGTGGCRLAIVVALPGGRFREVFNQHVLAHEVEPGDGARTIRFRLHGGRCGKSGPEPCFRRRKVSAKPFRVR